MTTFHRTVLRLLMPLLLIGGVAWAEDKPADGVVPYPLDHCATCKGEEGHDHGAEELVTKVHKGREIKLCKGCLKAFTADPDAYVKKVDKAIKEHDAKDAKKDLKDAEKAADKAAKDGAKDHGGHDGHEEEGHDHKDHKDNKDK